MGTKRPPRLAKAFGTALKAARHAQGITQEDLAEAADASVTFVSLLENGRRQPALAVIVRIERALTLPPGELVKRTVSLLGVRRR